MDSWLGEEYIWLLLACFDRRRIVSKPVACGIWRRNRRDNDVIAAVEVRR